MLQVSAVNLETGRKVVIIGISTNEIEQLKAAGAHFMVSGVEFRAPVDVVLFHGDTEAEMLETIQDIISPDTIISVDDALKN